MSPVNEKAWKSFVYWWLSANGYDYGQNLSRVVFTDGPSDGGIDVVAWPLENQARNDLLVVQSKYFREPPTAKDILRFRQAIDALNGPLDAFHGWLAGCRMQLHPIYRRLREDRRRLRFILISPSRFPTATKRALLTRGIEVQDANYLANLERNFVEGRTPRLDEIRIRNTSKPRLVAGSNGTRVWIFTAPVREFGVAFEKHGNVLFAGNIRYALRGQTAKRVRTGMLDTLENAPDEFVFSHNGVTISGESIKQRGDGTVMRSATIVNGAQTVSYLGSPKVMPYLLHNRACVIVKFVEVDDVEKLNDIESKVAFRSNNQNKVEPSDLMIELPSLVSLQRHFRRQGVHLERKKGEQKLHFGELAIAKERLAQVLAAAESSRGAVQGKSKQALFQDSAQRLFGDHDASEEVRNEALAWTRVDEVFRMTIGQFSNSRRRKRAQLAELASLRVFHKVIRSIGLRGAFLRAMARWEEKSPLIEGFLEKACKVVIAALLRISSDQKKNEPAFYKSLASVRPAVQSATWRSKRKIRRHYAEYLG